MKEELAMLWAAYKAHCAREEGRYAENIIRNYGGENYTPNKRNTPSFEGFMRWIESSLQAKDAEEAE